MKLKNGSSKKIAVLKNALRKGIPLSALIAAATALSGCGESSEREPRIMGDYYGPINAQNENHAPFLTGESATTPEKPAPKAPEKPAPKKPNAENESLKVRMRGMPAPKKPNAENENTSVGKPGELASPSAPKPPEMPAPKPQEKR